MATAAGIALTSKSHQRLTVVACTCAESWPGLGAVVDIVLAGAVWAGVLALRPASRVGGAALAGAADLVVATRVATAASQGGKERTVRIRRGHTSL